MTIPAFETEAAILSGIAHLIPDLRPDEGLFDHADGIQGCGLDPIHVAADHVALQVNDVPFHIGEADLKR